MSHHREPEHCLGASYSSGRNQHPPACQCETPEGRFCCISSSSSNTIFKELSTRPTFLTFHIIFVAALLKTGPHYIALTFKFVNFRLLSATKHVSVHSKNSLSTETVTASKSCSCMLTLCPLQMQPRRLHPRTRFSTNDP